MQGVPNERDREGEQARALRRYRIYATILLAVFAMLLAATLAVGQPGFWTLLLRAGAEAAIVGGLADWFAVTALFRRPLGLPIPHTAIVPRQKDRVGAWLGTFVVDNFLASHALAKEIKALDLVGKAARWLAEPRNAARLADRIVDAVPHALALLDDRDMRQLVARAFGGRLGTFDVSSMLGAMLQALVKNGHHKRLLARLAPVAGALLSQSEESFYGAVQKRLWFLPRRIDRYLSRQLLALLQDSVTELAAPSPATAARLEDALLRLAAELEQDERLRARVQAAFAQAIALPEVQDWLHTLWDDVRRAVLDDLEAPEPALRRAVSDGLIALGGTLQTDPAIAAKLTAAVDRVISAENVSWRARVARFITAEVQGWDTAEFTRRMELWAGRELQYIRINGTVLGFLIGVALFLVTELV